MELVWDIDDVGETPHVGPDKTLQIYRVLLEACTNALKHAAPRQITVSMRRVGPAITIALSDDGRGFDAASVTKGRGLANTKARAAQIGAALTTTSTSQGTRIALTLSA